ncbi:MAG: leucine-rich repeat protein [Firmicutes bacterium]|nr:leucine-rich repeat protein [Bacillota bacterium]
MISRSRIALRVLLILTLLLAVFTCSAYAATPFLEVDHNDLNDEGDAYGADFRFTPISGELQSVEAVMIKAYSGEDVHVPAAVTIDGSTYRVTKLCLSLGSDDYADLDATMTVPDELRNIDGNLFKWRNETTLKLVTAGYATNVSVSEEECPDTEATLAAIPKFISEHYDEDGLYYAGRCLVRVSPDYEGDLEVKDGTVCILASALEGCSGIGEVTLPDSVEFIGVRAFANSSVTAVNMPKGLMEGKSNYLPSHAFYGCADLETVTFDEGVSLSRIGFCAFTGCSSLTGFDFDKAEALETLSFAGAFDPEAGMELTLRPEQIHGYPMVFAASGIKNVVFLDNNDEYGYKSIPYCCFYKCEELTEVTLSSSVTSLGCRCFEGCSSLANDLLAGDDCAVASLDHRCLAMTALTEITIPETATSLSGGALAENTSLTTVNWHSPNIVTMHSFFNDCSKGSFYSSTSTTGTAASRQPDKTGKTCITTLHMYADPSGAGWNMAMQPCLEKVYIHNDAETKIVLPNSAFQFSPVLKTVSIDHPEMVTYIGECAFYSCPNLSGFSFEGMSSLQAMGNYAFMLTTYGRSAAEVAAMTGEEAGHGLNGTVDLTDCEALVSMGQAAFQNQYNMTELLLPENAIVGSGAFIGCAGLKSVSTEGPLTNLGSRKLTDNFYINGSGGTNNVLEYVSAGDTEEIPEEYFVLFSALKTVEIPGVKTVGNGAFKMSGLEEIVLSDVEEICDFAFYSCGDLKSVVIPKGAKFGSFLFANCGSLTDVVVEEGVTELGWFMFANCGNLENVALPSTLKTLSWAAFKNCPKLGPVRIPAGVTVDDDVFALYRMDRTGDFSILLEGAPAKIINTLDSETFEARRREISGSTYVSLLPIPDGSTVYCADEGSADAAASYRDDLAPELKIIPIDGLTVSNAPESVYAGDELDLTGLEVVFGDRVLNEDEYSLDYDPEDLTPGLRAVTVTCPELPEAYGDRVVIAGPGLTEGEMSGNSFVVSTPDTTQFSVNVIPPFEISVKAEPTEGGTVSGGGSYKPGVEVELTAKTATGYDFVGWTLDGETVCETAEYSFAAEADCELVANFKLKTFLITFVNPDGTELFSDEFDYGTEPVYGGEDPTMDDDEEYTYEFTGWDPNIAEVTEEAVYTACYDAILKPLYKITVEGGTADREEAREGETVTVTAESKSGYKFKTWTVVSGDAELDDKTAEETFFAMPAEDVELKAEFKKKSTGGSSSGPKPEEKEKFDDVPKDAYYHDPVYWAVEKGITEGTSPTTFSPMAPTTRADFVTFLWRAAGSPKVSGDMPFEDVPEGAYYHDAVLWAYQKGITEGTTPTTFRPDWTVTRGQAVTFLHRNAGEPEVGDTNPFTDVEETDYYYAPILWAVDKKIVEGTTPTTFSPDRDSYRAEVVTMLYRELAE